MLATCGEGSSPANAGHGAEGASMIRTLSKCCWEGEVPSELGRFFVQQLRRSDEPAMAESAALAVAHLLPVLLQCATPPPWSFATSLCNIKSLWEG